MVFTNRLRPFQKSLAEPICKGLALIWWGHGGTQDSSSSVVPLRGLCEGSGSTAHWRLPRALVSRVACGLRKREERPQVGLWPRLNHGVYKGLSDSLNEVGPREIAAFLVQKISSLA